MRTSGDSGQVSIASLLAPVRRKLWFKSIVTYSGRGWLVGSAGGIAILLLSRWWPIWHVWWWVLIAIMIGWAIGTVYGLIKRPSIKTTAYFVDRHGLQERMVTALAFEREPSAIARLQRNDAIHTFRCHEAAILKEVNVWTFPRWSVISFCGLLIIGVVLWRLPNPMDQIVRQQQQTAQLLEQEQQKLADMEEMVTETDDLPDTVKRQLLEHLQDLQKNLQHVNDASEGMKAFADLEAKLDELARQTATREQTLIQLPNRLAAHAALAPVSQALAEGDQEQLRDALNDLNDALRQLSPEEQRALAHQLNDVATAMEGSDVPKVEKMVSALRQAAEYVQIGQAPLAVQALGRAFHQTLAARQSLAVTQQTLADVTRSVSDSKMALAQVSGSDSTNAHSSLSTGELRDHSNSNSANNGAGNTGTSGTSNGNTNRNSSGNGYGSGAGSGNGSGHGGSGSGNSTRSGSGDGSGFGAGSGRGTRGFVSVPTERLTGEGAKEFVGGPLGEGHDEETIRSMIGTPGVTRPYSDVFHHYESMARQSLESSDLPPQLQHLIRDYFSDIRPD